MTENEIALLQRELGRCQRYLEFGAGNSTKTAVGTKHIERIDSVESSADFLEQFVLCDEAVKQAVEADILHCHIVDIGETGRWGFPVGARDKWPDYSEKIFEVDQGWDLVLIDGRFRVACALGAWLHLRDEVKILIHDFKERPYYHILLEFFECKERVDSFVLLEKKQGINREKVEMLRQRYRYLPGDQTKIGRIMNVIRRKFSAGE